MLFCNPRIVILFAVSCAALEAAFPNSASDLTSRRSYARRAYQAPHDLATTPSPPSHFLGSFYEPGQDAYQDPVSPPVHWDVPGHVSPSASPAPLVHGDVLQGHAPAFPPIDQGHASPASHHQPLPPQIPALAPPVYRTQAQIKALLEQYEEECETEHRVRVDREHMNKWDAVQLCIQEKAVRARIEYKKKPRQGPRRTRKWRKLTLTENNAETLSAELEAEYREKCKKDVMTGNTQKIGQDEWIELCIAHMAQDIGKYYKREDYSHKKRPRPAGRGPRRKPKSS
ncbi:hypothetical protein AX14_007443 [Amanita brunnescens Koide BX004]|nr:hypothetical protein AX14_007443 [Amanita brunnescens Koide BX004]